MVIAAARQMGGEIGVEDTPGAAPRFWFTLPAGAIGADIEPTPSTGAAPAREE
jgi:signal transduction histidine kinase